MISLLNTKTICENIVMLPRKGYNYVYKKMQPISYTSAILVHFVLYLFYHVALDVSSSLLPSCVVVISLMIPYLSLHWLPQIEVRGANIYEHLGNI